MHKRFLTVTAGIAGLLSMPVTAHHSFAVHFVPDRIVTITGTATDFRFRNPHGVLLFDVRKSDGSVERWKAETNAPNILRRRGWTPTSIKAGDAISVAGYPARDGSNYMRIARIEFSDGHALIGQAPTAGPPPAENDND